MNRAILQNVFEKKGYRVSFYDTGEEVADALCNMIESDKSIAFGGSKTLEQINAKEKLEAKGVKVIWHWDKSIDHALKKARECNYYAASANAVSETGEIVNIDGTGNRVSSLAFGHEKVFIVIGKNKIEKSFDNALNRAKHTAAMKNALRFEKDVSFKTNEHAHYEMVEKISRIVQVFEKAPGGQETYLLFVEEDLGY